MTVSRKAKNKRKKFEGSWHIQEMEAWDEDYFNMDVQAYFQIESNSLGSFQFGLVSGQLDGETDKIGGEEIFVFSWEGNDECDPASGCGWCRLRDENTIEGSIKLHLGDNSTFLAERVE